MLHRRFATLASSEKLVASHLSMHHIETRAAARNPVPLRPQASSPFRRSFGTPEDTQPPPHGQPAIIQAKSHCHFPRRTLGLLPTHSRYPISLAIIRACSRFFLAETAVVLALAWPNATWADWCHTDNHVSGITDGQWGHATRRLVPPLSQLLHDLLGLLAIDFGVYLRGHGRRVAQDDPGQFDPIGGPDAGGGGMPKLVRMPAILATPLGR